jgi:hypothetical protein
MARSRHNNRGESHHKAPARCPALAMADGAFLGCVVDYALTDSVSDLSGGMCTHERAPFLDRPETRLQLGMKQMPDVDHFWPDLKVNTYVRGAGRFGEADRIVEQGFGGADLDQQRRQNQPNRHRSVPRAANADRRRSSKGAPSRKHRPSAPSDRLPICQSSSRRSFPCLPKARCTSRNQVAATPHRGSPPSQRRRVRRQRCRRRPRRGRALRHGTADSDTRQPRLRPQPETGARARAGNRAPTPSIRLRGQLPRRDAGGYRANRSRTRRRADRGARHRCCHAGSMSTRRARHLLQPARP